MQPGNVDDGYAINELLDCCILYYYAVAHKYVVMVRFYLNLYIETIATFLNTRKNTLMSC